MIRSFFLAFCLLFATLAHGQVSDAPPAGGHMPAPYPVRGFYIFASIGGGNNDTGGLRAGDPLFEQVVTLPQVTGAFIRCPWSGDSPSLVAVNAGAAEDFSCEDNQIDLMIARGKPSVFLAPFEDSLAPATPGATTAAALPNDYVAAHGEHLDIINSQSRCGVPVTYPIPWGPNFKAMWEAHIAHLSAHLYATNRMYAVKIIAMGGFSADTAEEIMQMSNSGYTIAGVTTPGSCTCQDSSNTYCHFKVDAVSVPDQHHQWATLNDTVSPGQGYTRAKMVATYTEFANFYNSHFPPSMIFTHMSGYVVSENPTGGGPFNDATPAVDDNGIEDVTNASLAALPGGPFMTIAQSIFGPRFLAMANDLHGDKTGAHGRELAQVSSNLLTGGGAWMQWGQSICKTATIGVCTINPTCIMNGPDGTLNCTAPGELNRGLNILLDYGMQGSVSHPEDLLGLSAGAYLTSEQGLYN